MHPVSHKVVVAAIIQGTVKQQAAFIEEVCTVTSKKADMDVIKLSQDRYGHEVVIAMLNVSRHKQVHNILKASILCKQEESPVNEFAAKVVKAIKTEFHAKLVGNYAKGH